LSSGSFELSQSGEQGLWSSKYDPSDHRACALTSALSLIAGKELHTPKLAYPLGSPSKFARIVQIGNGLKGLLQTVGRDRVVITGKTIAWRAGEVEYSTHPVFKHWRSFSTLKQPFFAVAGVAPAESIAAFLGCDAQPAPRLYLSHVNCTLRIMANWGGVPAVLHLGSCSRAIADIDLQVSGLEIAASDPQISPLLPKLLAHKKFPNGATLSVQTRIPADPWQFSWRQIDVANEFWFSRRLTGYGETVDQLGRRLELVYEYSPSHKDMLIPIADALLEWYASVHIPGGIVHGDFSLGNVLFKSDNLAGVIDWDHVRKNGIPLVDALFMIVNTYTGHRKIPVGKLFRQLWTDEFEDDAVAERIAKVGAVSGMDKDGLKFLALMLWFDFLLDRAKECAWQPESWVEDMVTDTVPVIRKWLDSHSKRPLSKVIY
jgi:hypothetical protein